MRNSLVPLLILRALEPKRKSPINTVYLSTPWLVVARDRFEGGGAAGGAVSEGGEEVEDDVELLGTSAVGKPHLHTVQVTQDGDLGVVGAGAFDVEARVDPECYRATGLEEQAQFVPHIASVEYERGVARVVGVSVGGADAGGASRQVVQFGLRRD